MREMSCTGPGCQQMALCQRKCFRVSGRRKTGSFVLLEFQPQMLRNWFIIIFFLLNLPTIVPLAWINWFLTGWGLGQARGKRLVTEEILAGSTDGKDIPDYPHFHPQWWKAAPNERSVLRNYPKHSKEYAISARGWSHPVISGSPHLFSLWTVIYM